MRQLTLSTVNFDKHSKLTRRAKFLAEMDRVAPWGELWAIIAPYYPKAGNGRPLIGLERMLRLSLAATLVQSVRPGSRGSAV